MSKSKKVVEVATNREAALKYVKENTTVVSGKLDRKAMFHELLLDTKMKRSDVAFEIALKVYEDETPSDAEFDQKVFGERLESVKKSIANFCSRSLRPSTAKATYNHDPAYGEFELIVDKAAKTLEIVKRNAE